MHFVCTDAFAAYLRHRQKHVVSVEVAESSHSDIEVTEIYLRIIGQKLADELVNKRRYRSFALEDCGIPDARVLITPYVLEFDEVVTFDRVKVFHIFHKLTADGIRL